MCDCRIYSESTGTQNTSSMLSTPRLSGIPLPLTGTPTPPPSSHKYSNPTSPRYSNPTSPRYSNPTPLLPQILQPHLSPVLQPYLYHVPRLLLSGTPTLHPTLSTRQVPCSAGLRPTSNHCMPCIPVTSTPTLLSQVLQPPSPLS